MEVHLISPDQVRSALQALSPAQLRALVRLSGTPMTTLLHIREGNTENPGLKTVLNFWPHIKAAAATESDPA